MKTFKKLSTKTAFGLFSAFLLFSHLLLAAVEPSAESPLEAPLSEKVFTLPEGRGTLNVKVLKSESLFGLPYSIEATSTCRNGPGRVEFHAACDVKPGSVKLSGSQVLVKVREADSEDFNRRTREADPEALMSIEPGCKTEPSDLAISLEKFCK